MVMHLFMAVALGVSLAQEPASDSNSVAPTAGEPSSGTTTAEPSATAPSASSQSANTPTTVPPATAATSPSSTSAVGTPGASAAAEPTLAAVERITVAILSLEGNKAAQDDAPGVASILASTLAESPRFKVITQADIAAVIGVERQRTLMTGGECNSDACMTELAGALGSRYLVAGRLDRYGDKYVLTTSVFDSRSASSLAKPRAEVPEQERLPEAAASMGQQIRAALGDKIGGAQAAGPFSLSLKVGSGFIASLTSFAPSGDLELGYHFAEEWVAVVQVGFKPFSTGGGSSGVNLLPSFAGIRKLHFVENKFQPYWGLGLGIQLALGRFGIFEETGPLPSLWAVGGFQYMFTPHLGALLEGKTNLAQATLGLLGDQATGGFNIDLTAGLHYRF